MKVIPVLCLWIQSLTTKKLDQTIIEMRQVSLGAKIDPLSFSLTRFDLTKKKGKKERYHIFFKSNKSIKFGCSFIFPHQISYLKNFVFFEHWILYFIFWLHMVVDERTIFCFLFLCHTITIYCCFSPHSQPFWLPFWRVWRVMCGLGWVLLVKLVILENSCGMMALPLTILTGPLDNQMVIW